MKFKEIWETLSKVDLKPYLKVKMGITYLSWANAWQAVMEYYPSAQFKMKDTVKFDDGSVEVWTSVDINGNVRDMWLPVMDHRNNAIINPSSRQVSDARMRCIVKNLAMFGLGLYIYQGEDIPREESIVEQQRDDLKEGTPEFNRAVEVMIKDGNLDRVRKHLKISKDVELAVKRCVIALRAQNEVA